MSVLIPCYNAASWLREAAESILGQTHKDLEILIYNDGSTDESQSIVNDLASADSRIVPMGGPENHGIVHALNFMLDAARGQYIARMDADDLSYPNRIQAQVSFLDKHGLDLCGTWFKEFGGGLPRVTRWPHNERELRTALLFQNSICHPTVLARRGVFDGLRYRKGYELAEDYDLFVRACSRFRLANAPEVLLRYRRHPQQATRARRGAMEAVTRKIRIEALHAQGLTPSPEEQRIHHLVRAPSSVNSIEDLLSIEAWLLKIVESFPYQLDQRIIASQWTRAAVRAAPLGIRMWHEYRRSPLYEMLDRKTGTDVNIMVLALARLEYGSRTFHSLRRFGLSG